jgi:transposase-like protein
MMQCPNCHAEDIVKNGSIHNGKQKFLCKQCGRQFVEHPEKKIIAPETKALIDKLLLEKIPLAGIVRVTGVSER